MSKRKSIIIMLIMFLAIGFAAVSTTLVLNGLVGIAENKDDFDVVFTKVDADDDSYREIKDSGKTIEFETSVLTKVDDEYTLTYEVTNTSRSYDADVDFNINIDTEGLADVDYLPKSMQIEAGKSKTGYIKVKLLQVLTEPKEIKVKLGLKANALSRKSLGDYSKYKLPGMLMSVPSSSEADQKFWAYKHRISKIVFEDEMIPHETTEDLTFDVSAAQDGSVMAYIQSIQTLPEDEKNALVEEYVQTEKGMSVEEYKNSLIENGRSEAEANLEIASIRSRIAGLPEEEKDYYFNMYLEYIAQESGMTLEAYKKNVMEAEGLTEEEFNKLFEEEKNYIFPNPVNDTLYIQANSGLKAPVDSSYLFANFTSLLKIEGLDIVDTTIVASMSMMFYGCKSLGSLNLTNFNTRNVTDMSGMFDGCESITTLDVSKFDTINVTDMSNMFVNCSKLTTLDVSKFDTTNVTDMSSMFNNCSKLTTLDVSKFDTTNVTDMSGMFGGCESIITLDVSKFNTVNVTNMNGMFKSCRNFTELNVNGFNTEKVTDMAYMFYANSNLTDLDVSNFNTSNVTTMSYMFGICPKLLQLNVSNFNTSNVMDMSYMFYYCEQLTNIDVSNFNTSRVTNMRALFYSCKNLKSIDLSNFDTSNVTNMNGTEDKGAIIIGGILAWCTSLEEINLNNFNTSKLTSLTDMFGDCKNLKKLSIKNFDLSNIKEMYSMFWECKNLEELDISNWNIETIIGKDVNSDRFLAFPKSSNIKIYVKDKIAQDWILALPSTARPPAWTTDNIIIKEA